MKKKKEVRNDFRRETGKEKDTDRFKQKTALKRKITTGRRSGEGDTIGNP